eukprot:UN03440
MKVACMRFRGENGSTVLPEIQEVIIKINMIATLCCMKFTQRIIVRFCDHFCYNLYCVTVCESHQKTSLDRLFFWGELLTDANQSFTKSKDDDR